MIAQSTQYFINVLLPLPLPRLFTYGITAAEAGFLGPGMRVAVPFGRSKLYTALVHSVHTNPPTAYKAKEIHQILDEHPLVTTNQLRHWEWIAAYYMCTLGEVFRAAMPAAFLLESESIIQADPGFTAVDTLPGDEFLVVEALQESSSLSIAQVMEILGKKTIFPVLKRLLDKQAITIKEQLYERYRPKMVKYLRLAPAWSDKLPELLLQLGRAVKQRAAILVFFQLKASRETISQQVFLEEAQVSRAVLKSLLDKGYLELYEQQQDRVQFQGETSEIPVLTSHQTTAYKALKSTFDTHMVSLLKGVTGSGKTAIYAQLIQETLAAGKQVLYLLPEIALTTQLIERLQVYFKDYLLVYHSKYSLNERVEVWQRLLQQKPQLLIGARSSVFLPFDALGLIIVDEEHEPSFKQYDPAPRYHARDAAIVLAQQHQAKVLLGSATPGIESFYNAKEGKYGFVQLDRRYNNLQLPEIELIDLKEKYRKRRMNGHFSDRLIQMIETTLDAGEQVILFQNRRGYAPVVTCEVCGVSPQCPHCDVSLTYHDYKKELRCHYCGYQQPMQPHCQACGSDKVAAKGFGTEQIEQELGRLFPAHKTGRMDLDTTRGKYAYQKIIAAFQSQEIDVLVGTQMLSKGLDFSKVSLVGIMNADSLLNFPDFRAHERSYQLMVQVAGRSGRMHKRGKVAIQTFNPYHQILQQVAINDYQQMYKEQLDERWQYHYPPFYRLIKITLRHKDSHRVEMAAQWLAKSLLTIYGKDLLGPSTPAISRIRNYYLRTLLLKIPQNRRLKAVKNQLRRSLQAFEAIPDFRSVKVGVDVDPIN